MKNILTFLIFIIFVSCNDTPSPSPSPSPSPPPEILEEIMFIVDTSSDAHKLFLDKEGKIKKNICVIMGERKVFLNEIKENMTLRKVEENVSFLGLTTKDRGIGFQILKYVIDEIGKPFYITIDDKKKFEIIVTDEKIKREGANITVNGKETKFIVYRSKSYIILK